MIKKILLTLLTTATLSNATYAEDFHFAPEIEPFVGINLGATTSLGVPEETEKINSAKTLLCPAIGVNAIQMFSEHSGASVGLIFERKGGNSNVEMKNFETEITLAGSGTPTHGFFTGISTNHHSVYYLTLPVCYVYRINDKWDINAGMYFSYALSRTRTGEAYDGKIRTTPLVPAIAVEYSTSDWSDKVPRFDYGISVGATRQIWRNLDVKLDVNWGLRNTLNAPESGLTKSVYNLYACLGFGWRFANK